MKTKDYDVIIQVDEHHRSYACVNDNVIYEFENICNTILGKSFDNDNEDGEWWRFEGVYERVGDFKVYVVDKRVIPTLEVVLIF
tara:strand:+ start:82516 stop:82767 length:252 start_codon:yes stop_codon:yes gene_type:complete